MHMNYHNQGQYSAMAEGFMSKVYAWMCAGLATTAAVAYYLGTNKALMMKFSTGFGPLILLLLVQLGIIMYLGSNIQNISYTTAAALYITFTGLMGISLAPIQFVYTEASLLNVFITAAVMFSVMAVYGWVTKSDLSSMGNLLFMGLIGLIVAGVVNMFFMSSMFSLLISACGVGIFAMLTAYDVQRLKEFSKQVLASSEDAGKFAIMGAVQLYLNLINLFLYLLRIFGERRD